MLKVDTSEVRPTIRGGVAPLPGQPEAGEPAATRLVGRAAELLFVHGQTTAAIDVAVERLARALGAKVTIAARWGELTLQPQASGSAFRVAADPAGVDIGRVLAVEAVIDDLCDGRIGPDAAAARLVAVPARPPVAAVRFAVMAAAGAAALSIIFGAATLRTVLLVAISAGLGAVLRRWIASWSRNPFAQPFAAALLSGLVGGCAVAARWPAAHQLVAVCPCMILIPGPHFLNGAIDLARARIPLGSARIAFASLSVLAISTGLLAGLSVAAPGLPAATPAGAVPLLLDVGAAGVAVAAYGSFFNMPWRLLPVPIAVGMAAHALRWQLVTHGFSLVSATFAACLLVGSTIAPLADRLRLPFGASAFAAVVSMIPGIFMFGTASAAMALLGQDVAISTTTLIDLGRDATTAFAVLVAMAAGLIVPKMVLDLRLRTHGR